MNDFVKFEAAFYDDDNDGYNSEVEDKNVSDIDDFIDDNDYDESVETYYAFTNINRRLEDAVQDTMIVLMILLMNLRIQLKSLTILRARF